MGILPMRGAQHGLDARAAGKSFLSVLIGIHLWRIVFVSADRLGTLKIGKK
jgi:hypothetical protein